MLYYFLCFRLRERVDLYEILRYRKETESKPRKLQRLLSAC